MGQVHMCNRAISHENMLIKEQTKEKQMRKSLLDTYQGWLLILNLLFAKNVKKILDFHDLKPGKTSENVAASGFRTVLVGILI